MTTLAIIISMANRWIIISNIQQWQSTSRNDNGNITTDNDDRINVYDNGMNDTNIGRCEAEVHFDLMNHGACKPEATSYCVKTQKIRYVIKHIQYTIKCIHVHIIKCNRIFPIKLHKTW